MKKESLKIATIKNIFYVSFSQGVNVLAGLLKSFLLPIVITTVEGYAYWQIYLFYLSYILLFTLGFHEGIFLRYGGKSYSDMSEDRIKSSIRLQMFFLFVFAIFMLGISNTIADNDRRFVMRMLSIAIFLSGTTETFLKVFHCTNQMREFSVFTMLDKVVFSIAVILFFIIGNLEYRTVIVVDLIIKIFLLIVLLIYCKKIWVGGEKLFDFTEWKKDVNIGLKLLISSYMAIVITGMGRWLIETFGDLKEYSYYSFGLTVTNLVMLMINSIGAVLYPTLKKIHSEHYGTFYNRSVKVYLAITGVFLMFYYPMVEIIDIFIPKYAPSIVYINIFLLIVVINGIDIICCQSLMKAMRMEKQIFWQNAVSVSLFAVFAVPEFIFTENIKIMAYITLAALIFKWWLAKTSIEKKFSLDTKWESIQFLGVIAIFIVTTSCMGKVTSFVINAVIAFGLLAKNKDEIVLLVKNK